MWELHELIAIIKTWVNQRFIKKKLNEIIIHCTQIFVPSEWYPDVLDAEHFSHTARAIFFSLLFFLCAIDSYLAFF